MCTAQYSDISITLSQFMLKIVGIWMSANDAERRHRKFAMAYTIGLHIFSLYINLTDIYYSWGDFNVSIKPLLVLHKKVIIIFIASSIYTLPCTNNWTSSIVSLKVNVSVIFLQLRTSSTVYLLHFIANE